MSGRRVCSRTHKLRQAFISGKGIDYQLWRRSGC
ncbi:hypothetical protein OROHE_012942 [Orobanche hederae]